VRADRPAVEALTARNDDERLGVHGGLLIVDRRRFWHSARNATTFPTPALLSMNGASATVPGANSVGQP
jgi:hypothetical protein